jgi:hypothetical protein
VEHAPGDPVGARAGQEHDGLGHVRSLDLLVSLFSGRGPPGTLPGAMSKRRGPDDTRKLDPEEVLSGRVKVGAADLLALIHQVNPTGRALGARQAEARYAQKARLQSLLVRRFGDDFDVVPDPEREGTVSLRHRGHGRDACHAVVDALDEDARAWVRLQLDLGPPSTSEAAPVPAPRARLSGRGLARSHAEEDSGPSSAEASPESLVRRAEEAVASYDYERARALLERALSASSGAAGPAEALLALLVETLGDDAAAISLHASGISRAALSHPDVRAPLALAAARGARGDRRGPRRPGPRRRDAALPG